MGEIVVLLCILGVAWLVLKIIGAIFHLTFAALALPFQILAAVGAVLLSVILIIPFAILAGVLGILLAPLLLIVPLLPFILIGFGLFLLLRRNQPSRPASPRSGEIPHPDTASQSPSRQS
jgi:hypothetical protein